MGKLAIIPDRLIGLGRFGNEICCHENVGKKKYWMICLGDIFVLHAWQPGHRLGGPYESQSPKLGLCTIKAEDGTRMSQQTQPLLALGSSRVPETGWGWQ